MDRREDIGLSSDTLPYYIGAIPHNVTSRTPTAFRTFSTPNAAARCNIRLGTTLLKFSGQPSSSCFDHETAVSSGVSTSEPVMKRKRGRPRKLLPDGQISFRSSSSRSAMANPLLGTDSIIIKRSRGRPPGTGRKQQLATLGEWMNSSAGQAFAPYVVFVEVGQDIVAKILSFSQLRPRALCVLSGRGAVSSVTLLQPASQESALTFEGHFEILSLSGSYLVAEDGGSRNRIGGVSASLCSSDGQVIGGATGELIAATEIQVIVGSFMYGGGSKNWEKQRPYAHENCKELAVLPSSAGGKGRSATPPSSAPLSIWVSSQPVPAPRSLLCHDVERTRAAS